MSPGVAAQKRTSATNQFMLPMKTPIGPRVAKTINETGPPLIRVSMKQGAAAGGRADRPGAKSLTSIGTSKTAARPQSRNPAARRRVG